MSAAAWRPDQNLCKVSVAAASACSCDLKRMAPQGAIPMSALVVATMLLDDHRLVSMAMTPAFLPPAITMLTEFCTHTESMLAEYGTWTKAMHAEFCARSEVILLK